MRILLAAIKIGPAVELTQHAWFADCAPVMSLQSLVEPMASGMHDGDIFSS